MIATLKNPKSLCNSMINKRGKRYFIAIGFFFIFAIFSFSFGSAVTNSSFSEKSALECLNSSKLVMLDMLEKNFSTLRINDTIRNAESYYNTQIDLKKKNRNYDFSKIKDYCNQVINIQKNATDARDQVDAFMKFYNDSAIKGMNTSSIDAIVKDINLELADERYEQVPPLVDKAYNELSNVRASYTALNVFYKNTATGLKVFFLNNWKAITILVVLAVILFFIYRIRIVKWLLNRKIESLETRKKVVKELIMKAQKDYFQSGTLAEGDYNIKTKKFAEIIRDIDRQMPLLKEELAKLNKQWKT